MAEVVFNKTTATTTTTTTTTHICSKLETSTMLHLGLSFCMVLKPGYFGKQIRNTRKVLKCGARKGSCEK